MSPIVNRGRGYTPQDGTPSEGPELIVNGDFSSGLDGWTEENLMMIGNIVWSNDSGKAYAEGIEGGAP